MYNKTVLKNGTRILSERLENYRSVSLGIWVNVGSRDESEGESGISHFIEHMLFKGTRTRNSLAIAKELDGIGGLSNAFTSKEYTCLHARVLDKDLPILADILSDLLLNSLFDLRDIDQEKKVVLQEISMVEDTPDDYIHVIFNRLFWVDHPLGRSILGTIESVTGIEKEAITAFMKRHYRPDKIVVTAILIMRNSSPIFNPVWSSSIPRQTRLAERPPTTMPVSLASGKIWSRCTFVWVGGLQSSEASTDSPARS